jgi:hypothetical protein
VLRGAFVWDARSDPARRDLFTAAQVLPAPAPDAQVIDLEGCTLFPGLVNAHDHLELNHYPRTTFRARYANAHEWGEDVNAHLDQEPYKRLRAFPLAERCFIGGLKNLLCGALTVAHHNPPHPCLFRPEFPVRVLRRYGWAHSLHFTSDTAIKRSFRATPPDTPWFIHVAEGTDDAAAGELPRLRALRCLGENTVMIHGVGLDRDDTPDARRLPQLDAGRMRLKLVWCPSTNLFLLGQTISAELLRRDLMPALGSDSRLTGDGDLLDELQCACRIAPFDAETTRALLLAAVTTHAQRVLGRTDIGHLNVTAPADWIARRGGASAISIDALGSRGNLALVVRAGVPQIGDPDIMAQFTQVQTIPAVLDGHPKRIHQRLAAQVARCSLQEPGLEIDPDYVRQRQRRWPPRWRASIMMSRK